ncbi:monooxygenase [Apiospora arundinis]
MRRRQNSSLSSPSARGLPLHLRQPSKAATQIEAKSPHVSDPFLQSFLSPSFDPASYLNAALPPLQAHVSSVSSSPEGAAQALLSQLNAQTTRLTNTLTQLTDDILRSGSRLAYEVELLRGETLSLSEALTDGLHDDVAKFVPNGLQGQMDAAAARRNAAIATEDPTQQRPLSAVGTPAAPTDTTPKGATMEDPAYISQLQTLALVRSRLDSVIKTFGDAMEFVFPPSELSVTSGFLSVSAPDAGGHDHSTEEKGQQVLKQFKEDIMTLLSTSQDPVAGIEKAAARIEELKELLVVWNGTAEEKGRTKFIDTLAKLVEDRHKELLEQSSKREPAAQAAATPRKSTEENVENKPLGGYGLMSQLQKLRGGL